MNNTIDRHTLLGAIIGVAPHLVPWFNGVLLKDSYTVTELNTLMRYHLIQLGNNSRAARSWLCESSDINLWVHYFCLNVIPFISKCLGHVYVSPSAFANLMAV